MASRCRFEVNPGERILGRHGLRSDFSLKTVLRTKPRTDYTAA